MWPDGIVVTPPGFDHDPGLLQTVEDLTVEELVAQLAVEAFAIAIFPGASGFDVGGPGANSGNPVSQRNSNELRTVVGADMGRDAAQDKQVAERIDDVCSPEVPGYPDGEGFACELIDDAQHPEPPSVVGALRDKVIGPDMIGSLGPKTDTRSVVEPETAAFRLSCRNLQPLTPPDPLDPLPVHCPASCSQQCRNPAVAVAAILAGQCDDVGGQGRFVFGRPRYLALRGPVLAQSLACTSFRHAKFGPHMVHAGAAACGA